MFHPTRGGVRGGRDQFKWDDVKTDKDRFNYLGNSLMAPVKKPWDQGPEAGWYVKGKGDVGVGKAVPKEAKEDDTLQSEKERIKAMETEYMASVLSKGFGFNKAQNTVPIQMVSKSEALPKKPENTRIEGRRLSRDETNYKADREHREERPREHYHHHREYREERPREHYHDHHRNERDRRERSPSRDRSHRHRHERERSPPHRDRRSYR